MRLPSRTALLALVVAALAVLAAGCGAGEIASDEVPGSPPALVVPTDSELGAAGSDADETSSDTDEDADADADAGTADPGTAATPPADTSGGTVAPETQAAPAAPEETAPEETPPPAGSPPEQFESFCEQNAGAC
jgi:hypothetical protein